MTPQLQPEFCLTSREMSRQTGATLRQLQWWDEQFILQPVSKDGHRRLYEPRQVATARRLLALSRAGVQVRRCSPYLKIEWTRVRCISKPTLIGDTLVVPYKRP